MDESIELLLLLPEDGLTIKDARLALALILFLLVGDSLSPSLPSSFCGGVATKQALFSALSTSEMGPVEPWLESSSSKSRMDVGWWPMVPTSD